MVTREEFRKQFYDKAVCAERSPGSAFSTILTGICLGHSINPNDQDISTHIQLFALSLQILMHELEIGIFGEEETNER